MSLYKRIFDSTKRGNILILDGGTGTELEKRGVPMDPGAWCGLAALEHADILKRIHTLTIFSRVQMSLLQIRTALLVTCWSYLA